MGRLLCVSCTKGLSARKPSCDELEEKEAKVGTVEETQSQEEVEVIVKYFILALEFNLYSVQQLITKLGIE